MKNIYRYKISSVLVVPYLSLLLVLAITTFHTTFAQQQPPPVQEILARQESSRAAERVYIATDRDAYVAGETMWLSVYCIDIGNSSRLSNTSSIVYIELHNAKSLVLTAKVALTIGRGSGAIELPPNLPTGNYKVISYTKQMLNEQNPVLFEKIIPVYNVLSSERVEGQVVIGHNSVSGNNVDNSSSLSLSNLGGETGLEINFGKVGRVISTESSFSFYLNNSGESVISANISIFKRDSISNSYSKNFAQYFSELSQETPLFINNFVPEYEGEIISGKVICENNNLLWDKALFLSAAGGVSDVYSTYIDSAGSFTFFTTPFFGNRDLVLEVPKANYNLTIDYTIHDPFLRENNKAIPLLVLDSSIFSSLKARSIEMQLGRRFRVDTLYSRTAHYQDHLLQRKSVTYKLDDYVRFPVMREVITEYIPELRFRKIDKKIDLQVMLESSFQGISFSSNNSLVLLDGVPIFDHEKIEEYNPLRVESISIFNSDYIIGVASFNGVVSFRTYKGDYSGINFGESVRILEYQGALYPSKMSASTVGSMDNLPDMRSMLYWDPTISLSAGEKREIKVHTSSVPGEYIILVEGISARGVPFTYSTEFLVD